MSNNLPWNDEKPFQPHTKTGEEVCECGHLLLSHRVYWQGRPCKRVQCDCKEFRFADVNGWAEYERSVNNLVYNIRPAVDSEME